MSPWPSSGQPLVRRVVLLAVLWAVAFPGGAKAQGPAVVEITGASRVEFEEATGVWTAEGQPVTVTRGRTVLRASRIRYDQRARVVAAEGGAELTEPGISLAADAAELRLTDDRVRATGRVKVVSTREDPPVEVRAVEIDGILRTRTFTAAGDVSLTRGDATLSGRRLDYDDATRIAVATGDPAARFREAVVTAETITLAIEQETLRAEGAATVRRGELTGGARRVEVRSREGTIRLVGDAQLTRGPDRVTADEIQAALDGSRIVTRGGSRVVVTPR